MSREEEVWVFRRVGEGESSTLLRDWLRGDSFLRVPLEGAGGLSRREEGVPGRQSREYWGGIRDQVLLGLVIVDFYPRIAGAELTLVVAPTFRRRGLGRFLLEKTHLMGRSVGLRWLDASVDEENEPARLLFEGQGFVSIAGGAPGMLKLRLPLEGED